MVYGQLKMHYSGLKCTIPATVSATVKPNRICLMFGPHHLTCHPFCCGPNKGNPAISTVLATATVTVAESYPRQQSQHTHPRRRQMYLMDTGPGQTAAGRHLSRYSGCPFGVIVSSSSGTYKSLKNILIPA